MEPFRVVMACAACDALHVVSGSAPRDTHAAAVTAFSCKACGRGYCSASLPVHLDVASLRIDLKARVKT
jgi:hypothetical protein